MARDCFKRIQKKMNDKQTNVKNALAKLDKDKRDAVVAVQVKQLKRNEM